MSSWVGALSHFSYVRAVTTPTTNHSRVSRTWPWFPFFYSAGDHQPCFTGVGTTEWIGNGGFSRRCPKTGNWYPVDFLVYLESCGNGGRLGPWDITTTEVAWSVSQTTRLGWDCLVFSIPWSWKWAEHLSVTFYLLSWRPWLLQRQEKNHKKRTTHSAIKGLTLGLALVRRWQVQSNTQPGWLASL